MFDEKLKEYRLAHCMSLNEMADFLGITYATYWYWENGSRKPNYKNAKMISEKLKIKLNTIYD